MSAPNTSPTSSTPSNSTANVNDDVATATRHRALVTTATWAGLGLLVMAIIAPIANFILIPAGLYGVAAIIMFVVALIDVFLGPAISLVLDPKLGGLARVTAALRILYGLALAVASFPLFFGDVSLFQNIWDVALAGFGAHLIAVAILGLAKRSLPIWICILVGIAGLGYVIDAVVMPFVDTSFELSTISFVGEVVLMIWFLLYRVLHRKPDHQSQDAAKH